MIVNIYLYCEIIALCFFLARVIFLIEEENNMTQGTCVLSGHSQKFELKINTLANIFNKLWTVINPQPLELLT